MYGQNCGRGPCTTFVLPPISFFVAAATYSAAVFEQNIASTKRRPFMRYQVVSLLQHFISKSFLSILAVASLLPSMANKCVH